MSSGKARKYVSRTAGLLKHQPVVAMLCGGMCGSLLDCGKYSAAVYGHTEECVYRSR